MFCTINGENRRQLILDAEEKILEIANERAALDGIIEALNGKLIELDAAIERINGSTGGILGPDLETITLSINEVKTQIDSISTSVDSVKQTQEGYTLDLQDLISTVETTSETTIALSTFPIFTLTPEEISDIRQRTDTFNTLLERIQEIKNSQDESETFWQQEMSEIQPAFITGIEQAIKKPIQDDLKRIENLITPIPPGIIDSLENLGEVTEILKNISQVPSSVEGLKKDTDTIQNKLDRTQLKIDELRDDISFSKTTLETIHSAIAAKDSENEETRNILTKIGSTTTLLETGMEQIQRKVDSVDMINSNISDLSGKLVRSQLKIDELSDTVSSTKITVETIHSVVTAKDDNSIQILKLKKTVATIQKNMDETNELLNKQIYVMIALFIVACLIIVLMSLV